MYIKTIKKDYGNSLKILSYNRGVVIEPPKCKIHFQTACPICWTRTTSNIPKPSSLQRTKTRISDYTLANKFDLFATFTFNPELVDSFNYEEAKAKMSKWLNNAKRESPYLKYLIVAELHKSGRIHFHALMKNYLTTLQQTQKTLNGRKIFNITKWHYGFSTAIKIDNIEKVSSYVQKYITKDMLKISNKKRYWASRNLIKPIVDYNVNMIEEVYSRPLFVMSETKLEYFKVYRILKSPPSVRREKRSSRGEDLSESLESVQFH